MARAAPASISLCLYNRSLLVKVTNGEISSCALVIGAERNCTYSAAEKGCVIHPRLSQLMHTFTPGDEDSNYSRAAMFIETFQGGLRVLAHRLR
jgi:hypothetical protein